MALFLALGTFVLVFVTIASVIVLSCHRKPPGNRAIVLRIIEITIVPLYHRAIVPSYYRHHHRHHTIVSSYLNNRSRLGGRVGRALARSVEGRVISKTG